MNEIQSKVIRGACECYNCVVLNENVLYGSCVREKCDEEESPFCTFEQILISCCLIDPLWIVDLECAGSQNPQPLA